MRNDPFVTLGVRHGSSREEILNAYHEKRDKYQNDLFLEGEAGADAAKKLQELDLAFNDALQALEDEAAGYKNSASLAEVRQALTEKRFDDAQSLLDQMEKRDAEWHYLQSIVFYNKNWFTECKNQLEIAVEIDPSNEKYSKALGNLKAKLSKKDEGINGEVSDKSYSSSEGGANPDRTYSRNGGSDNTCCNICSGLLCADCCCECMGGDLIACC